MPQYFSTIQLPDDFDPSMQDEAVGGDMHALGLEMEAAGIKTVFAGGLHPAASAKTVRVQADGTVLVSDGPYLEAKEHIGGFSIVEYADMDEALKWASKAAAACRMPGEIREMLFRPPPKI